MQHVTIHLVPAFKVRHLTDDNIYQLHRWKVITRQTRGSFTAMHTPLIHNWKLSWLSNVGGGKPLEWATYRWFTVTCYKPYDKRCIIVTRNETMWDRSWCPEMLIYSQCCEPRYAEALHQQWMIDTTLHALVLGVCVYIHCTWRNKYNKHNTTCMVQ